MLGQVSLVSDPFSSVCSLHFKNRGNQILIRDGIHFLFFFFTALCLPLINNATAFDAWSKCCLLCLYRHKYHYWHGQGSDARMTERGRVTHSAQMRESIWSPTERVPPGFLIDWHLQMDVEDFSLCLCGYKYLALMCSCQLKNCSPHPDPHGSL